MIVTKPHLYWITFWMLIMMWLFLSDMMLSQEKMYRKNWKKNQYEISYLFPLGRTTITKQSQIIIGEPVYFTVYVPYRFTDTISLSIEGKKLLGWRVGYQVASGFHYKLFDLPYDEKVELSFPLHDAYIEKNKLRLILSKSSWQEGETAEIYNLSVSLIRNRPFSFNEYIRNWMSQTKQFLAHGLY